MHLPNEFRLKVINWVVNLAFQWADGRQKVKHLEAQLENVTLNWQSASAPLRGWAR